MTPDLVNNLKALGSDLVVCAGMGALEGEHAGLRLLSHLSLGAQVSRRGGREEGHSDLLKVREPCRVRRGEERDRPVKVPVQHLLIDTLKPDCFGQLGLIKVVPAKWIPGQGRALAEGGEGC